MKESELQDLRKIAATLPPVKRKGKDGKYVKSMGMRKVRGEVLIREGQKRIDGEKIIPSKFYRMRKPVIEHHLKNLKEAYKLGGMEAVEIYRRSVLRVAIVQVPFRKLLKGIYLFIKGKIKSKKKPGSYPGS